MDRVVRLSNKKYFIERAPRYIFWLESVSRFAYITLCKAQLNFPLISPFYKWFTEKIYSNLVYFVKSRTKIYIGERNDSKIKLYPMKKWK